MQSYLRLSRLGARSFCPSRFIFTFARGVQSPAFHSKQPLQDEQDHRRFSSLSTPVPKLDNRHGPGEAISAVDQAYDGFDGSLNSPSRSSRQTPGKRVDQSHFLPDYTALAEYMEEKDAFGREMCYEQVRARLYPDNLPDIVLHYMHTSSLPESQWKESDHKFRATAIANLQASTWTLDDITSWASILSADGIDDMANRLSELDNRAPAFVFSSVTRFEVFQVRTLEKLIKYAWDVLEHAEKSQSRPRSMSSQDPDITASGSLLGVPIIPEVGLDGNTHTSSLNALDTNYRVEDDPFMRMISRLLHYVRLIWPASMVSMAHILARYMRYTAGENKSSDLDPRLLSRLSTMYNFGIHTLSMPATTNPLKSMVYNWAAQKLLLKAASEYQPALVLDQRSYWAVTRVILASKKTPLESKSATLRARSWPPWRIEQDGMDAQRLPDEDLSRAVLAVIQAQESGYSGTAMDDFLKVYGGQDADGTPTIHTRKSLDLRERLIVEKDDLNSDLWAARIEATRDIQEAWSAFVAFQESGGIPNLSMYLAMFEKLNYEGAAQGRSKNRHGLVPGDAREVFPVSDDNYSEFYRSRLRPPSAQQLYTTMIKSGLQPGGKCLAFLISYIARTPSEGIQYLYDSSIKKAAIKFLMDGTESGQPPEVLERVPIGVFTSWLRLICRFAPRPGVKQASLRLEHPIHHACFLLKARKPRHRPAWYTVFNGLCRPNVVLSRNLEVGLETDQRSWKVLSGTFQEFRLLGLELDPFGFQLVCQNYARYARTAFRFGGEYREDAVEWSWLLKEEFRKISQSADRPHWLPKLLHPVSGSMLHMYVRCMGHVHDHREILRTLKWMVDNLEELEFIGAQSQNGPRMLRRVLIAIRTFLLDTKSEQEARLLVEEAASCHGWHWPEDAEVEEYLVYSNESAGGR